MTEIRHIVFDIGRVLIHYDAELIRDNYGQQSVSLGLMLAF